MRRLRGHRGEVFALLPLGQFLLSVGEDNRVCVWDMGSEGGEDCSDRRAPIDSERERVSPFATIELPSHVGCARVTCAMHPHTYLNKIVLGFDDGSMQLWNIRTQKLIHQFDTSAWTPAAASLFAAHTPQLSQSSPSGPARRRRRVVCIEQSPAVDVVGVGLDDGSVVVHNLKLDQMLMSFSHHDGPVTALTFRSGLASLFLVISPFIHWH